MFTRSITISLMREASVHAKKNKHRGITADAVRSVTEVGFLPGYEVLEKADKLCRRV